MGTLICEGCGQEVDRVENKLGRELLTSRRFNVECGGGVYHRPHTKRREKQVKAFLKKVGEGEKVRDWMIKHPGEVNAVAQKYGVGVGNAE